MYEIVTIHTHIIYVYYIDNVIGCCLMLKIISLVTYSFDKSCYDHSPKDYTLREKSGIFSLPVKKK